MPEEKARVSIVISPRAERALRDLALELGFTSSTGRMFGQGNVSALLDAMGTSTAIGQILERIARTSAGEHVAKAEETALKIADDYVQTLVKRITQLNEESAKVEAEHTKARADMEKLEAQLAYLSPRLTELIRSSVRVEFVLEELQAIVKDVATEAAKEAVKNMLGTQQGG